MKCNNKINYHPDYEVSVQKFTKVSQRCPYCAGKKVHPKNSFAQWGINTCGFDFLDKYWSDKNTLDPWSISIGSKKEIWIKCPIEGHSDYPSRPYRFKKKIHCPYCSGRLPEENSSFAQWGIDTYGIDFLEKYWDYEKNDKLDIDPWKITTKSSRIIYLLCQHTDYHPSYETTTNNFYIGHGNCPYCNKQRVHPYDSLGSLFPVVLEKWSYKNEKSPFEYALNSNYKVWFECENGNHEDYLQTVNTANRSDFCCPKCNREKSESLLQEKVNNYFNTLKYQTKHEFETNIIFRDLITNRILPYDNEVMLDDNKKLMIEVHGSQHYKITTWHKKWTEKKKTTPEKELEYQQWKDKIKKDYALSQGYYYLEIPYWTDDKEETWKKLIDDKIEEIHNN